MKHAFALALFLLAVSPCFAAKDKGGIGPQTDFTNVPPEQVLALLKTPESIEITAAERRRGKLWFKMCESDGSECSSLASSDDLSLAIRLSIIGCSFEAVPGHQAMSNCPSLAEYLLAVGNIDAARAVIKHAPGCHGFSAANDPNDQCFDALESWPQFERLRESMPASEMAMLAKDAYSYAPSDVRAAEYLNGRGADIDIAAAEAVKHDATEANNAAVREHNVAIDRAEMAKDAQGEALLNTLQSTAQANQPSVATTPTTGAATAQSLRGTTALQTAEGPNSPGAVTSETCPNMQQVYPDAGASCKPVRSESTCVRILSATWNPPTTTGDGMLRVTFQNICSSTVRITAWGPAGGSNTGETQNVGPGAQYVFNNDRQQYQYQVDDCIDCAGNIMRPGCKNNSQ